MQEDILIQISDKIREKRKEGGITLQELADKAKVSKGLVSQIENSRTVPSLPVLVNLIKSLDIDLNDFFSGIVDRGQPAKVVVKHKEDYQVFEKEPVKGFQYRRIISKEINNVPVDIVLLELKKDAKRSSIVKTDAYEYKYVIKGSVQYAINGEKHLLNEGDSIFFDGRLGHKPANVGDSDALILVVYFFIGNEVV